MSKRAANRRHEAFYQDLATLLKKHAGHLSALEMLAIASNAVGKIVAMQDQRTVTPAMAMDVVARNIELGNEQTIAELMNSTGAPQ